MGDAQLSERPLQGLRVMVTRPEDPHDPLAEQLGRLGAEVIVQPAIRITPPADWRPVDAALARLERVRLVGLFQRQRRPLPAGPASEGKQRRNRNRLVPFSSWRRLGRAPPTSWRDTGCVPTSCPSSIVPKCWPRRWRTRPRAGDSCWPGPAAAARSWPNNSRPPAPRWSRSSSIPAPTCKNRTPPWRPCSAPAGSTGSR